MLSYCVKEKKVTDCVAGSEKVVTAKNGRKMMKCVRASCGAVKTRFVTNGGSMRDLSEKIQDVVKDPPKNEKERNKSEKVAKKMIISELSNQFKGVEFV